MQRLRRTVATIGAGALALGLLGANPVPETGEGRAQTQLQLLSLELTDVPVVGDVESSLGTLLSRARTVDGSAAGLLLQGLVAAGVPVGERSYDAGDEGSESIPLGDVGSLSLVDYLVAIDDRSATATLGALAGELDGTGLGTDLLVSLGERGLSSVVTEDGATSVTTLELPGIGLAIGDLLPDGLLDELPLGLLDDLLGALPIELPTDLDEALALLDEITGELEALLALETEILDAHDDLVALLEVDTLDEALAELDALDAQVEALQIQRDGAQAQLDSLGSLSLIELIDLVGLLDADCDITLDLAALVSCLDGHLRAVIAALDQQIEELTGQQQLAEGALGELFRLLDLLDELLDDLAELIGQLPDLDQLRDDLADELADTPLFGLGGLVVEVITKADVAAGTATVTCDLGEVSVLGETPRSDVDCSELDASFAAIEDVVGDLLGALPLQQPLELPGTVSVGGLEVATAADASEDGERTATASLSALSAAVGSVGLEDITDLLTGELSDLLGDASDALGALDGIGLLDTDLLGGDVVMLSSASVVEAAAIDELAGLLEQVDSLPLGDGLDGLRTVGLDLEAAGISSLSGFEPASVDDPGGTEGPTPGGPSGEAPVVPQPTSAPVTPATTGGGHDLPKTGGGLSLLGLAMLLGATVPRVRRG